MFDWDRGNIEHIAKHRITPSEAEQVILNEPVDLRFELRNGEERITQVGETVAGRILVVVTTTRDDKIRVVTAIPANRKLRKLYLTQKETSHERGTEEEDLQE
jgi:uncharacterized DUF497 family protein